MMVIDFIRTYWRELLAAVELVVVVILWIVKKRPVQVVDTLKETIVRLLPYCINSAESAPKGEKLAACLAVLSQVLADMGIELNDDYKKFALEQVEVILSTPQKKGIK